MLVDRCPPADIFILVPALHADFEPVLRELDHVLDDNAIAQGVRAGFARRGIPTLIVFRGGREIARQRVRCPRRSSSRSSTTCCAESGAS